MFEIIQSLFRSKSFWNHFCYRSVKACFSDPRCSVFEYDILICVSQHKVRDLSSPFLICLKAKCLLKQQRCCCVMETLNVKGLRNITCLHSSRRPYTHKRSILQECRLHWQVKKFFLLSLSLSPSLELSVGLTLYQFLLYGGDLCWLFSLFVFWPFLSTGTLLYFIREGK